MDTREYYSSLSMDSDPFRKGIDGCCAVHTYTGRFKKAVISVRDGDRDPCRLEAMERCYRGILAEGYGLAKVCAQIYVLELDR